MTDDVFYLNVVGDSFLGKLAQKARKDLYDIFMRELNGVGAKSLLDVGVSVLEKNPLESNIFERLYPYRDRITMLGIHEGAFLETQFPGARYVQYDPQGKFPFEDNQFDICYCNAVIEHIGLEQDRDRFLREVLRVGKRVFLATPNRWYPIEFHKMIPFLHWLPQRWYRKLLGMLGDSFYSQKENLELMSKGDLKRLFERMGVPYKILTYRFMGAVSNLIVVAK